MKLPQNNVLGGNKLNCFKATQVPDKLRGTWSFDIKLDLNLGGGL